MVSIVRQDITREVPTAGAIFAGQVLGQDQVSDSDASQLLVTAITFAGGTCGFAIATGDLVLIQPYERHRHGAAEGKSLPHLSIVLPSQMTIEAGEG